MSLEATTLEDRLARFDFRGLCPGVRFGTASDRYGGWLGQIYSEERWAGQVSSRKKRLGKSTFEERVLPVESVSEYFEHFDVLEIDFTFYRPLLEADARASTNYFVLSRYAEHAPDGARFLLKVPQMFSARVLRRSGAGRPTYVENPSYLDGQAYLEQFLEPAIDMLGGRLGGVLFEQEYSRVSESPPLEAFTAELDAFFGAIEGGSSGRTVQAHLEVRSPHLLQPPYFDWLGSRGLGFCFSHWTWLPPIRKQLQMAGGRFPAADRNVVLRLLTPLKMRYEDAYALAHPFDRPVAELSETPQARAMVDDTAALVARTIEAECEVDVIVNNRAWGSAPALAQSVARRVLDEAGGG